MYCTIARIRFYTLLSLRPFSPLSEYFSLMERLAHRSYLGEKYVMRKLAHVEPRLYKTFEVQAPTPSPPSLINL